MPAPAEAPLVPPAPLVPTPTPPAPWHWSQRAAFRFAFLFWGELSLQWGAVWLLFWWAPWLDRGPFHWLQLALTWPVDALARFFAAHVFHLTGEAATRHPTGSGDSALDWINALATLTFALLGSLLWTLVSELRHRRRDYRTLLAWLFLTVRFSLASILLSYGFSKLFPMQFSTPGNYILRETYGQSSPMALLWTFIGFSPAYTVFGGLAEVIPGLLLLFRRTATLGALGAVAVLLNIVLLNFCYDVPVKLASTTYLVTALFLLLPDAVPLWRFLVLRRTATPTGFHLPRPQRKALRIAAICVQASIILHLLYMDGVGGWRQWRDYHSHPSEDVAQANKQLGIDGTWTVDTRTGWPPAEQWATITIGTLRYNSVDYFTVVQASGTPWMYSETTSHDQVIRFQSRDAQLHWTLTGENTAKLEGHWLGQPVTLTMHRNPATFPLLTRGFHWVQEFPYNR